MSKKKAPAKGKPTKPRDQPLPGMEDSAIKPLEDAAHAYAELRDERMGLSRQEVDLKQRLIGLMKTHGKDHYQRDGITIDLVQESETVKVRVKKAGTDEGAGDD